MTSANEIYSMQLGFNWDAQPIGSRLGRETTGDYRPLQLALARAGQARFFNRLTYASFQFYVADLTPGGVEKPAVLGLRVGAGLTREAQLCDPWQQVPNGAWDQVSTTLYFSTEASMSESQLVLVTPSEPNGFPGATAWWQAGSSQPALCEMFTQQTYELGFSLEVTCSEGTRTFVGDPEMTVGTGAGDN